MREWLRCALEIKKNKIKFKDKPIKKYFIMKSMVLKKTQKVIQKELSDEENYSASEESENSEREESKN